MSSKFANKAAIIALIMTSFSLFISCKKEAAENPKATVFSDLNIIFHGEENSVGFIEFRQYENRIIYLDTWVVGLEANHNYVLQRAVDPLDNKCTGTEWLTLGKGLQPQSIMTDSKGNGRVMLFTDVSAIPSGSTFDIHFQILDEAKSAVVLTSECYQYTVR